LFARQIDSFDRIGEKIRIANRNALNLSRRRTLSNMAFYTVETKQAKLNPLTPTVVMWIQLWSILCQVGLSRHL